MKTTISMTKVSMSFCCKELYREVCSKEFPRIRLSADHSGCIRPVSHEKIFKFCPFCGKVVRTTMILSNRKVVRVPDTKP